MKNRKQILDDNFIESIETFRLASYNIILIFVAFVGIVGAYLTFQKSKIISSLFHENSLYLLIFIGLILYPCFVWINNKKYIFTPNYIISSSRILPSYRIGNIIGFEYQQEISKEKNGEEVIVDILIIIHQNGSLKLDSGAFGNFYSIREFVEKHYQFIDQ